MPIKILGLHKLFNTINWPWIRRRRVEKSVGATEQGISNPQKNLQHKKPVDERKEGKGRKLDTTA